MGQAVNGSRVKRSVQRFKGLLQLMARTRPVDTPETLPKPLPRALARARKARENKFLFEGLEPRLLFSADPFTAAAGADLTLRVIEEDDGTSLLQIVDNSADGAPVLAEHQLLEDGSDSIVINGVDDSDESLTLDASLTSLTSALVIEFHGGSGSDSLKGPAADTVWDAADSGASLTSGTFTATFTGVETVVGDNGDDTLGNSAGAATWTVTEANSVTLNGILFSGIEAIAGGSADTLDYSAYSSGVEVDLNEGYATGFTGATGFLDLVGSDYDDTLTGNALANRILGGAGSDVLSGGLGQDTLIGGSGSDSVAEYRDADFVLTDGVLNIDGSDEDSLSEIEGAALTGGDSANRLDASAFTLGAVVLDGGAGDDTLIGSDQDDTLTGGRGNDSLDGGAGNDQLWEQADADFSLTDSQLTVTLASGSEVDSLSNLEGASLTGGIGSNSLDASGFTLGGVILSGGAGSDTLRGSAQDDRLSGGAGADRIFGNAGSDTLIESGDNRYILTDSALDSANGTDAIQTVSLSGVTDGTFTLSYKGEESEAIAFDASAEELADILGLISAFNSENISVSGVAGAWEITFINDLGRQAIDELVASGSFSAGSVSVATSRAGASNNEVQHIRFTGVSAGRFTLSFDGQETDSLAHDASAEEIAFALGQLDTLSYEDIDVAGSAGDWTVTFINNQAAQDVSALVVTGSADFNGSALVTSTDGIASVDTLDAIERAELTGGASGNLMDASGFSGSVVLKGGAGMDTLIGGAGSDQLYGEGDADTLTGGAGSDTLDGGEGIDLLLEQFDADMTLTNTALAHGASSDSLIDIELAELSGGDSANTLDASGFTGLGENTLLAFINNQQGITPVDGADLQITLRDGTTLDVDLTYADTIQDVLDAIETADANGNLTAALNSAKTSIVITDATSGAGDLSISALNGSTVASVLGLAKSGSGASLGGDAIISGYVALEGGAGADTLIGSSGNDRLSGGSGNDSIDGGAGTDTLVAVRDADQTLSNTHWKIGNGTTETDTLSNIEQADLSGGASANTLDASTFSLGAVILRTGGGVDTLKGSKYGDDQFYVDVTGLLAGTDRISVDLGGGTDNEVIVSGMDSAITQEDFDWITFSGDSSSATYTVNGGDEATISGNISVDGMNIKISANNITVKGYDIDTSHSTAAGDITLSGEHITLDEGAQLLALATSNDPSAVHGDITLLVESGLLPWTSGWYNYDNLNVDITVGKTAGSADAQTLLRGGNIVIGAVVDSQNYLADTHNSSNSTFKNMALSAGEGFLALTESLALIAAVSRAVSSATIELGEYAAIKAEASPDSSQNSGNVAIVTDSLATANASPYSYGFAAAVGLIENTSKVTVSGSIDADADVYIHADAENVMNVLADPTKLSKMAGSVAVSIIDSTAEANVTDSAVLNVGGNLTVSSNTSDSNTTVARSIAGTTGKLGIAIAVAVEDGDTHAYLDGSATVAGDIRVDASMDQEILNALPRTAGVKASAGVGTNSKGDYLTDAGKAMKSKLTNPVKDRATAWLSSKSSKFDNWWNADSSPKTKGDAYDIAAAIAVHVDYNNVVARIGDGTVDGASPEQVKADGDISVAATLASRPNLTASSKAIDYGAATGDNSRFTTETGVSAAIAVGLFYNDADAYINNDALVDSKGTLSVSAETLNQIDPTSLWGANLIAPLLEDIDDVDYTDSETSATLTEGTLVEVSNSDYTSWNTEGGTARFQYISAVPLYNVDLTQENFNDATRWLEVNEVQDKMSTFVTQAATYLDSNLGLDDNLIDSWTTSRAEGQKKAAAGAAAVLVMDHEANATIRSGAQINQDATFQAAGDAQHVVVEAASIAQMVNLGGNFKPFGIRGDTDKVNADGSENTDGWKPKTSSMGFGSKAADGGSAVGLTLLGYGYVNDVQAKIEDGVQLYADSLKVDADNDTLSLTFGASGGQADNMAFNGVMLATVVDNSTIAQVEDGATVVVGSGDADGNGNAVLINASDSAYIITVAGAVATSETTGVGASVAVNVIERDTEALIGSRHGDDSSYVGGSFTAAGNVKLHAQNDGLVGTMALAGSKVSKSPAADADAVDSSSTGLESSDGSSTSSPELMTTNQSQSYQDYISNLNSQWTSEAEAKEAAKPGQAGMGISGSVTLNYGDDDARAYIRNAHALDVGDLTISADDASIYGSIAGGMTYVKDDNGGSAKGIAGAVGLNFVTGTVEAQVVSADSLTAGALDFDATRNGWVVSLSAGIAGATGRSGMALAGSVSISRTTFTTRTGLNNIAGTTLVNGGINLNADDHTQVILLAGSGGFGGKTGIGAAVSFTEIENSTSASISNLANLKHSGNVDLSAQATGLIVAVTGSVGASTGQSTSGIGAAGTLSMNFIDNDIRTTIADTTTHSDSTGDIALLADDHSSIYSFAGGFAKGKSLGLGFALGLNFLDNSVSAGISGSTLRTTGGLSIRAEENSVLGTLVVGAAGAEKLAVAGGVAATDSNNSIHAYINGDSNITTGGAVLVDASDSTVSVNLSGGAAYSSQQGAVGAAIGVNLIGNSVTAEIDSARVDAGTSLDVLATAEETLVSVAVGGAYGQNFAAGGSISVNEVSNTVVARIVDDSDATLSTDVLAGDAISLLAGDNTTMVVVAGGGAYSSKAAVGAAVSTTQVQNSIKAYIDSAKVESTGASVNVLAGFAPTGTDVDLASMGVDTSELPGDTDFGAQIINVTIAGAYANNFAAGAAISLNWLNNGIEAYIKDADIDAAGDVTVAGSDDASIISIALGASGSSSTGAVGAALSYNYIGGDPGDPSREVPADAASTDAGYVYSYISGSTVDATGTAAGSDGDVNVFADSTASIINVTIGAAATGGTAAVSGSISINFMRNILEAGIREGAVVNAATDINVRATTQPLMIIVSGAGAGAGGTFAGAAAVATNDMVSSLDAAIEGAGTVVTAGVGNSQGDINVAARVLKSDETPDIALSDDGDPSTEEPQFDAQIWAFAISGSGAGTAGAAGSVALNWIRNSVSAHISDGAVATAASGTVDIAATDRATINALAGAGSGAGTGAVGASIAYNYIGGNPDDPTSSDRAQISAIIDNATVNAGAVSLLAESDADINNLSVAGSGGGTFAGAGALSLNFIRKDLDAGISNGADINSSGAIAIEANDSSGVHSIAGQVTGAGTTAVGVSVAYNDIDNQIDAYISGSSTDVAVVSGNSGNIAVTAKSVALIETIAAGVSGSGTASVAGSGAGNLIGNRVSSYITGASVSTDNSLALYALSDDSIKAWAGTLSGSGTAGLGGTTVVNELTSSTYAYISNDADIAARGLESISVDHWSFDASGNETASTDSINGIAVIASNDTEIDVIAASGGLAGTFGLGANVQVTLVSTDTAAYIDDAAINSDASRSDLRVLARSMTDITSGGGGIGVGLGAAGIGASIDTILIDNKTRAYIDDNDSSSDLDRIYAGDLDVLAFSTETVASYQVGVGAGLYAGVAGAASAIRSTSKTESYIRRATVDSSTGIDVDAGSNLDFNLFDGAIGAGLVGAGGSVSVALLEGTTSAFVEGASLVAGHSVDIDANSWEQVDVIVGTAAVGVGSLAGAVSVIETESTTQAYVSSYSGVDSFITTGLDLLVDADNDTRINQGDAFVGVAAVAGAAAGGSVEVITLNNAVSGYIGSDTQVLADRHIKVRAEGSRLVDSMVVAGAAAGSFGIAGAVSVFSLGSAISGDSASSATPAQGSIDGVFDGSAPDEMNDDDTGNALQASADSSLFTVDMDGSVAISGISAYVGSGANLEAGISYSGGDIIVSATETLTLEQVAGAAAIGGVAGVGGAVAIADISSETTAFVDNDATLATRDEVSISATFSNTSDVYAYGGAAGMVGLGAQVAMITDNSSQRAFTDHGSSDANGVQILKADDVSIAASADRDLEVQAKGVTVGSIAAGAAVGEINVGGSTEAYLGEHAQVGQGSSRVDSLSLSAISSMDVTENVWTVAAGIGAGTGNDANVTIDPLVQAYIGDDSNITVDESVALTARVTPYVDVTIHGVAAGAATVGVSLIDVVVEPTLIASIGNPDLAASGNGVVIEAASVSVNAENLIGSHGYTVDTESTSASTGLLLGVDASVNRIENNSYVRAGIADNAELTVTGQVEVLAENETRHRAKAGGGAGSLIAAVGVGHAEINTASETYAYLGTDVAVDAGSLSIKALSENDNFTDILTGSVGLLLSGAGARAKSTDSSKAKAWIDDASGAAISLDGDLDNSNGQTGALAMVAQHSATFDYTVTVFSAGILAGTGADVDHAITSDVEARIGQGVVINALDIDIAANSLVEKDQVSGKNTEGYAVVAAGVAVAALHVDIDLDIHTEVLIDSDAVLQVGGTRTNPGAVNLHALNSFNVQENSLFVAAGGIAIAGVGSYIDVSSSENVARVTVGSNALIDAIGEVVISARGNGDLNVRNNTEAHGVGTVAASDATVDLRPDNDVTFLSGARVLADLDLRVSAGTDTDFNRDAYTVQARSNSFSVSVIPITDLDATANLLQTNHITVASGALLETGGIAYLHAERAGYADMFAKAKGTNWVTGLNDLISGTEVYNGDVDSNSDGVVEINGTLRTGANRNQSLVLTEDASGTISGSGEIGYSLGSKEMESGLIEDLAEAKAQLAEYGDSNADLKAYYEAEVTRITAELQALGLWEVDANGLGGYVESEVRTIVVDPVWAQAGYIDIRSDGITGSGVIDAPGDANVTITNDTSAYLEISDIIIPDTSGGLYLNGEQVNSNSEINALNDSAVADASLGSITDNSASDPSIVIQNVAGHGVLPDITINGDIYNYRGLLDIYNSDNAGNGNVYIYGDIAAKNMSVTAGGALVVDGATRFQTGGEGYSLLDSLTSGGISQPGLTDAQSDALVEAIMTADSANNLIKADRISIDASWVNLNGILQSGDAQKTLTLGAEATAFINSLSNSATGRVWLSTTDSSGKTVSLYEHFNVYYNTATGQLEVEDVAITGGYISISGKIVNTGAGEIRVLGGYGDIAITNNTAFDLVVNRVDNGERGDGYLELYDRYQNRLTIYEMDENGGRSNQYVYSGAVDASGNRVLGALVASATGSSFSYSPKTGARYAYSVDLVEGDEYHLVDKQSAWLGIDWISKDPKDTTWDDHYVLSQTLKDEGPYFYLDAASASDAYIFSVSDPDVVTGETSIVDRWKKSTWYGETTYYTHYVMEGTTTTTYTHSLKADRAIGISFMGDASEGDISITSSVAGVDLRLADSIVNSSGTTTLSSQGAIVQSNSATGVGGRVISLSAVGDIGAVQAVNTEQTDHANASLSAVSSTGVVRINELTDALLIDQIRSSNRSEVSVTAESLGRASGTSALVYGGALTLTAEAGAIGSSGAALQIDTGNDGASLLNASASGDIFISEQSDDLRVQSLVSSAGDVWIEVAGGSLVDGDTNAEVDTDTYEDLVGIWQDLKLRAEDGANDKIDAALGAYAALREGEYRTYWNYRNQFAGVYDAAEVVSLSADEERYYRNEQGYDDAAIAALEAKRTQEYHDLHGTYGVLGDSYDAAYSYTLSASEEAQVTEGIRVWTEDELLNLIGAGLLQPVTDTVTEIEADNIQAAGSITLMTHASVGSADGQYIIDVSASPLSLSDDDKVALASAERADVSYLTGDFVAATVNFIHSDSEADRIVRTDGGDWSGAFAAGDFIRVFGSSDNAGESGEYFEIASVTGDTLTLVVSNELASEYSRAIELATITPDPLATTDYQVDLTFAHFADAGDTLSRSSGSWIDDGFVAGMRIALSGSSVNDTDEGQFYSIVSVTDTQLTLSLSAELEAGSDSNVTVSRALQITKIVIDQRDDIDLMATAGVIHATANSHGAVADASIYLGSEQVLALGTVESSGVVRIKSATGLSNGLDGSGINVAGADVVLEAGTGAIGQADSAIRVDVVAGTTLTARATGDIHLVETAGDMEVGTLYSQTGGIFLESVTGSIVDGLNHSFANISVFTQLEMIAGNGAIGESNDRLELDLQGDAYLSVTAGAGSVYLEELVADMNIGRISASGDIDLIAQGSILDTVDASGAALTGLPEADLIANNISLVATAGAIGASGNDLDLDSAANGSGVLTSSSYAGTYLIETTGDLSLNTVGTGSDDVAYLFSAGAILNGNSDANASNVSSGRVKLFAAGDIGAESRRLQTLVGYMEGSSSSGDVWITNTGHLTIGGMDSDEGMVALGSVSLIAHSPVSVEKNIRVSEGDLIILATDDADDGLEASDDDIRIGAGISLQAEAGSIYLYAGDDLEIGTGAQVRAAEDLELHGNYGNADGQGAILEINGVLDAGNLRVYGSDAADTVRINGLASAVDSLSVASGAGADRIEINAALAADQLLIDTGAEADVLEVQADVQAQTALALELGLGDDRLEVHAGLTVLAGDLGIQAGQGIDTLYLAAEGSLEAQSISIDAGAGNDDIDLLGSMVVSLDDAEAFLLDLGADNDDAYLEFALLRGDVRLLGNTGDDAITLVALHSRDDSETLLIDGGDDSDSLRILTRGTDLDGTATDYIIDVTDSGSAGTDRLTIEGRESEDLFLVREHFVARMQGDSNSYREFGDRVERINYDSSISDAHYNATGNLDSSLTGGLRINGNGGSDQFFVDDNSAVMVLDGGSGVDSFQVGQVFGQAPVTAAGDEIETTLVTRGYLSNGVSADSLLLGGEDNDYFSIYSNKAKLRMEGEGGNDEFSIRAFIATDELDLDAGSGDDYIEYNVNAPVSINGGGGSDTVSAIGTEGDDVFLVTANGIFGAGLTITVDGVEEFLEVDGLDGHDTFYIQSTADGVITRLIGGYGSDAFIVTGDLTETVAGMPAGAEAIGELLGPVMIEGGASDQVRSLKTAVMLPSETVVEPVAIDRVYNESEETDSLRVYNDYRSSDQSGVLSTSNLSGLGMGSDDVVRAGLGSDPDQLIKAGINYAGIDVLELLLGEGNDSLTIDTTALSTTTSMQVINGNLLKRLDSDGDWYDEGYRIGDSLILSDSAGNDGRYFIKAISADGTELTLDRSDLVAETGTFTLTRENPLTVVHGGGNQWVGDQMGGDTFTVIGSGLGAGAAAVIGTSNVPLVIFGDTAQDGLRYAGIDQTTDEAINFANAGNDLIDASAATAGVVVYGGAGNDTLIGSQGDDHLAGGSGDDRIDGQQGDDHLYGDGGINVDSSQRLAEAHRVLTMVTAVGAGDASNGDTLAVGRDTLSGGAGSDIILGDHGVIEQSRDGSLEQLRIMTTGNLLSVSNAGFLQGAADRIEGGADRDLIIAGAGDDRIDGGDGGDYILGDFGLITRDRTQLVIESTDAPDGGDDEIIGGEGNDYIIAGGGGDRIDGSFFEDFVIGGWGRIIVSISDTDLQGDQDQILSFLNSFAHSGLDWVADRGQGLYQVMASASGAHAEEGALLRYHGASERLTDAPAKAAVMPEIRGGGEGSAGVDLMQPIPLHAEAEAPPAEAAVEVAADCAEPNGAHTDQAEGRAAEVCTPAGEHPSGDPAQPGAAPVAAPQPVQQVAPEVISQLWIDQSAPARAERLAQDEQLISAALAGLGGWKLAEGRTEGGRLDRSGLEQVEARARARRFVRWPGF